MVADAYSDVSFGSEFVACLSDGGVGWLEACSRITVSLDEASALGRLPYAEDPGVFGDEIDGSYVLRGDSFVEALVLSEGDIPPRPLMEQEASSTTAPSTVELGDIGQVEGTQFDDLQWLTEELGLCEGDEPGEDKGRCQEVTQAYLAGAFLQATDMHPHGAAARLRELAGLLHDPDGTRFAALSRVVGEFVGIPAPPSDEQMAAIASTFADHTNDGTHYAAAGQWVEALTEYVQILNRDIGWPTDESVAFVMAKYGTAITDTGDIAVTAFVQMHLEGVGG
jgi:hypothetical protein